MKNSNAKYLIIALILIVGVVGVSFYSCEKEEIAPNEFTPKPEARELVQTAANTMKMDLVDLCGEAMEQAILNPEGKAVGKAFAYNDQEFFYLELIAQKGFKIRDVQMHLAFDREKFPLDAVGNPDVEAFSHIIKAEKDEPRRVIRVPLAQLRGNTLVSTAVEYVKVSEGDQARVLRVWVDGKMYGSSLSGYIFNYRKGVCLVDDSSQDLVDEK